MQKITLPLLLFLALVMGFHAAFQNKWVYRHTLGKVSDNISFDKGKRSKSGRPFLALQSKQAVHWDAVKYNRIRKYGYDSEKLKQRDFAFFPAFALVWRASGLSPVGVMFLNYALFGLALVGLLHLFVPQTQWAHKLLLGLALPSVVVFLMPYSEAVFFVFITLAAWAFMRQKTLWLVVALALASMTRPSAMILSLAIVATELMRLLLEGKPRRTLVHLLVGLLPIALGMVAVALMQYEPGGPFFKFYQVQSTLWDNTSLRLPGKIQDWSEQGFAIHIGILFMVVVPAIVFFLQYSYKKVIAAQGQAPVTPRLYLQLLSVIYLVGTVVYIIFSKGGSLNGMFRYTLCTPFFYILLFSLPFEAVPFRRQAWWLGGLFLAGIAAQSVLPYARKWEFNDLGFFLLAAVLAWQVFHSQMGKRTGQLALYALLTLNALWTSYLLNWYLSNGWIFT